MRFLGPASGCPAKPPLEMTDVADNDLATGSRASNPLITSPSAGAEDVSTSANTLSNLVRKDGVAGYYSLGSRPTASRAMTMRWMWDVPS